MYCVHNEVLGKRLDNWFANEDAKVVLILF
jgi:hypothetical protein